MSKHTEGPWTVGEVRHAGKYQLVQRHDLTGYICEVQAPYFGNAIDTDTREANARLIAAAPQLLEALEQAATLIYQYHNIGALLGSDHGLCPEYEDCKLCTTVRSLRSVLRAARGQEA
jgi:hypothetical protein